MEGGVFWLFAQCAQGVQAKRLQAALDRELELMATEKVAADELARAKSVLSAAEAYEGEAVSDLAEDLGGFAIDASWQLSLTGAARRAKVSAAQVRDVAARLLTAQRRVVGWSLPRAGEETQESTKKGSKAKGGRA